MTAWRVFICLFFMLGITAGYPAEKFNVDKDEQKNEVVYPNGTVVGKYAYMDTEGNPINVKYYADNSGYGVELNSLKIIQSSTKDALQSLKTTTVKSNFLNPMEPLLDLASEIMNFNNPMGDKYKPEPNLDKPEPIEKPHIKTRKNANAPDYETFYQNDVKAPKQCQKEKVRVYLVKEKRKTRNALGDDEAAKFCGLF